MSHLFFDLNIFNYSLNELKSLINLPEVYNFNVIGDNILTIKEKILDLKLPENENNEYMCFLNNTKMLLKNDLDKKKLKEKINNLKKNQDILKFELNCLREKKKKIKKE